MAYVMHIYDLDYQGGNFDLYLFQDKQKAIQFAVEYISVRLKARDAEHAMYEIINDLREQLANGEWYSDDGLVKISIQWYNFRD